jgi:hypothetical protein
MDLQLAQVVVVGTVLQDLMLVPREWNTQMLCLDVSIVSNQKQPGVGGEAGQLIVGP